MARKNEIPKLFDNQYTKAKQAKFERIKELGKTPYPNSSKIDKRTILAKDFLEKYSHIQDEVGDTNVSETMVGRVKLHRDMGKAGFLNIVDPSGNIQGFISRDESEDFAFFKKGCLDTGDIVSMTGFPFMTKTGELTLRILKFSIVAKSTATPIGKHAGLQDEETKYRKRYLDMISNEDVLEKLITRSKIESIISTFFVKKDFLSVRTPMLNSIPGGANARPFVTFHNALDAERYLRIAPELYLKRLVVGGMEKVFEMNQCFRNEGVDATHNPEFTSIEFYEAYATYKEHMKMIEKLFKKIYRKVKGNKDYILDYSRAEVLNDQEEVVTPAIDMSIDLNEWNRIPFREALITIGNIPEDVIDDVEPLSMYLREQGSEKANGTLPLGKLWEIAFDDFVEDKLINPTFITEYPADISPLARRMDKNPSLTERFELFVAGRELANGFNELNDPFDQYERFEAQVNGKDLDDEDDESMHMDEDFIEALMNAMPPTAGTGIGIDRLVMLFTNSHTIRDIIAFPAMK